MSYWTAKSVVITGGSGSLGQALVPLLLEREVRRLVIFSRGEHRQHDMQARWPERPDGPMRYLIGDVRSRDRLRRALHGTDAVIHAAALKHVPVCQRDPWEAIDTNIGGTRNVIEAAIDEGVARVMVVSSDKSCVKFSAPVKLADGSSRPIWKIVRDRDPAYIETLGQDGIQSARVTEWHKNKLAGRSMISVSYENARCHRGQRCGPIVTEDHPVLTPHGWLPAGKIDSGDPLITAELAPNCAQAAVLTGCILGDSSVASRGRGMVIVANAASQQDWVDLKHRALQTLGATPIRVQSNRAVRQPMHRFALRSAAFVRELRLQFYPEGKKIVPRALVARVFSPIMLAAWFLDDGCLSRSVSENARLATHGLPWNDVSWLAALLTSFGIEAYVYGARVGGKKYPEIRLTVPGTRRLFERIGAYIPNSMRHKAPSWIDPFDARLWDTGKPVQYLGTARVTRLRFAERSDRSNIPLPPTNKGKQLCYRGHALERGNVRVIPQTGSRQCLACVRQNARRNVGAQPRRDVYCLGVAGTENFTVGGVVLHNCAAATLYGATKYVAEAMAVAANGYAGAGPTRISAVRYGNVIGSAGSVLHVWRQQAMAGQPIEITDAESTRFWIALPEAARFVLGCVEIMAGREVFIPRLCASRVADLAAAVAPSAERRTVGLRAGEKRHEFLIGPDEVDRAWTFVAPAVPVAGGEHLRGYVLWPTAGMPGPLAYIVERVPPDFVYSSDTAPQLQIPTLRRMMQEVR